MGFIYCFFSILRGFSFLQKKIHIKKVKIHGNFNLLYLSGKLIVFRRKLLAGYVVVLFFDSRVDVYSYQH